ncbi:MULTISPECIES: DUF732 domain-containing protein [Mycobacterium]|jgi:hypothetical protein|uniref:DUF732 domain-containing protein n=1 Tax=Mycobacterium gordonae TaxID=1778 RepID=A0A1A6B9P5_MYCGO|nr:MULTISPECIES: DUF732 domain-containing protein [Mycobacterium]MBI2697783.1 DUF732 domain-containing protein [Mycobacterium sp.]MBX9979636.1 DUF732 domain-containing protein [Mycobacterium gordonae]MCQ4362580.1 DUF732 domain-containing protein [Mycobacterium gordonae]MCV7004224.1 DUF732 domain-containing protein [Mycobacterium gordonae]OBR98963.1 hypothetical protein A9W98_32575 [Mycobacterium gordonae]
MTAPAIALRALAVAAGVFGVSATVAAPIHADMMGNAFLNALNNAGIPYSQPATAIALGRSVCPKALSPGGSFDAIVSEMAEINGLSQERAAAFTIVAIATYCPALIAPMLPHRLQA